MSLQQQCCDCNKVLKNPEDLDQHCQAEHAVSDKPKTAEKECLENVELNSATLPKRKSQTKRGRPLSSSLLVVPNSKLRCISFKHFCSLCRKKFKSSNQLMTHVAFQHVAEAETFAAKLICDSCKQVCSSMTEFDQHASRSVKPVISSSRKKPTSASKPCLPTSSRSSRAGSPSKPSKELFPMPSKRLLSESSNDLPSPSTSRKKSPRLSDISASNLYGGITEKSKTNHAVANDSVVVEDNCDKNWEAKNCSFASSSTDEEVRNGVINVEDCENDDYEDDDNETKDCLENENSMAIDEHDKEIDHLEVISKSDLREEVDEDEEEEEEIDYQSQVVKY